MRNLLIAVVSLSFILASCGGNNGNSSNSNTAKSESVDTPDSGFTNKAEAKNEMKDGLKEGKWIEYSDSIGSLTTNNSNAYYYTLTQYKAGKPYGIVRNYYNKNGQLHVRAPYKDSKLSGIYKVFYQSGKMFLIVPFADGKPNGTVNAYYESGKPKGVTVYNNGQLVSQINYDENGNQVK